MSEQRPVNWWVRVQVGALTLLLLGMAAYRFFFSEPYGRLDAGLIVLILFVIVLILSEAFDSFSVGKLLSISREIEKKDREVTKLEDRNAQLFAQLVSVTSQQSQSQNHISVSGDYHAAPRVEKASPEDLQQLEAQDSEDAEASESPQNVAEEPLAPRRLLSSIKLGELGLQKYLTSTGYNRDWVLEQAKLISDFRDVDSIGNFPMVFDAFVKAPGNDIFVEVKRARSLGPTFRRGLYVMLSKIDHYRRKKNVDAHLELVIVEVPSEEVRPSSEERLLNEFQPALSSGLLRMNRVQLTAQEEEQAARYYNDDDDEA